MRVAVVSNGPSANDYPGPDGYDLTIGVTNACLRWPFDYVCCRDGLAFGAEYQAGATPQRLCRDDGTPRWLGDPVFCMSWEGRDWIRKNRPDIDSMLSMRYTIIWPAKTIAWSGLAALSLLGLLGIREADAWGFDLAGDADLSGFACSGNRPKDRWEREITEHERLLSELGITLNYGGTCQMGFAGTREP